MTRMATAPPEFDGRCALAVSFGKLNVPGKASWSTVHGGKRYQFSNPVALLLWKLLPGRRARAEAKWRAAATNGH